MSWTKTSDALPPENTQVRTKIDDEDGARNEQELVRRGSLWFTPDRKTYVYYVPTHWRFV